MKCILAKFAIWSCLSGVSSAQIIIQKSDAQSLFNSGGHFQFFSDTSSLNINVGRTGGPNVYDFTSLPFFKDIDGTMFQVSQVPQLSVRYPGNAFFLAGSLQNIDDVSVHSFSGDSLFSHGDHITISPGLQKYQHRVPPQLAERYPLTYNSSWSTSHNESDTTYVNGVPSPGETKLKTNTAIVDGFGTLRIPGYEFQCLRLRFFQTNNTGDSKRFIYETRGGVSLTVYSHTDQPDTGNVQTQGAFYFLGGSLVRVQQEQTLPASFLLQQNYPNPFNPTATIEYHVPVSGFVTLGVYDVLGREITLLVNENKSVGRHSVTFDATDLPGGVYFYRMQAGQFQETRKLVLLK